MAWNATISAPLSRANSMPLLAALRHSSEPSVGIRIRRYMVVPLCPQFVMHHHALDILTVNPANNTQHHCVMKITAIRTHILKSPLSQPFAFSQGWVKTRSATLVEITTDTGLVGWGEAFAQGLEAPEISAAAIEHALQPLLLGADPLDIEVLWHSMYHRTRDFGRKGTLAAAISAIDIALWDIAGKHYGVPISKLLGGAFRTTVQPYATGFYRIEGQGEAQRLADEALQHFEAGFRAMKVKLGFGVDDDIEVMRAVGRAARLPVVLDP